MHSHMLNAALTHLASFDHEDALKHFGEVAQVEGVVGSGRSWQQVLADAQVHLNAALHHGLQQGSLHIQAKLVIHEAAKYGSEHDPQAHLDNTPVHSRGVSSKSGLVGGVSIRICKSCSMLSLDIGIITLLTHHQGCCSRRMSKRTGCLL